MKSVSGETMYAQCSDRQLRECKNRRLGAVITFLLSILFASPASAFNFTLGDDVQGTLNTTVSLGTSWRTRSPDHGLIGEGNANQVPGARGQDNSADSGNLNYKKGDRFSTALKFVSDLELKHQNVGGVMRIMGWKDFTLANHGVFNGHDPNGHVPGATLNDDRFYPENKFSNIVLQDLYVYGNFDTGGGNKLNLRGGKQVVNWGESLFIQGINSYGTVNVAAVRRPGAEVKEILLPYNQLFASFGIASGPTIEAWYQLKWERTKIDPCGTFFSFADFGFDPGCRRLNMVGPDAVAAAVVPGSFLGLPPFPSSVERGGDITPKDSGQFGLSMRYRAESLDTDFGAYYTKYHARTPYVGFTTPTPAMAPGFPSGFNPKVIISYPDNIKSFGLSAATLMGLWSVAGEVNHTWNLPVQINGKDQLLGIYWQSFGQFVGLPAPGKMVAAAAALPPGGLMQGYDRMQKTQIQGNFIRVFNDVLKADSMTFVGEAAYIHTGGLSNVSTRRYGRQGFIGLATEDTTVPCLLYNTITDGCSNEGFVTKHSWGYRLLGELSYTGVISGTTLLPRVFWSHDVSGYAPDGTFIKGRKQLGLAMKADFQKKYFGEISYTINDHSARYDPLRDRDFIAVNVGMSF